MIHEHATSRTLGLFRIGVFGIWLIKVALDPMSQVGFLPTDIVELPGVFALIPESIIAGLMRPGILLGLKLLVVTLLTAAVLGIQFRRTAPSACVLLFAQQALYRGFGFVNHAELGLLWTACLLSVFPCADSMTLTSKNEPVRHGSRYAMPLVATAIIVSVVYAMVGVHRVVHGSLDLYLANDMKYWLLHRSYNPLDGHSTFGRFVATNDIAFLIYRVGFVATTVFELLTPLCLFWKNFRRAWLVMLLSFHLLSPFVMSIFFWENILLLAILTDFEVVFAARPAPRASNQLSDTETAVSM